MNLLALPNIALYGIHPTNAEVLDKTPSMAMDLLWLQDLSYSEVFNAERVKSIFVEVVKEVHAMAPGESQSNSYLFNS